MNPQAFGVFCTMLSLEVPLYFLLMVFYSLLFSTYKLYLVIREMLGFSEKKDYQETEVEEEEEGKEDAQITQVDEKQSSLLSRVGNAITENKGSRFFRHSLRNPTCITVTSYVVDFVIISCMITKFVTGMIGIK